MPKKNKNNNQNSVLFIPVIFALLAVAFTFGLYIAQQSGGLYSEKPVYEEGVAVEEIFEPEYVMVNDIRFTVNIPAGWSIEDRVSYDLNGWTFGGSEGFIELVYGEDLLRLEESEVLEDEEFILEPNDIKIFKLGMWQIVARVYYSGNPSDEFLDEIDFILNSVGRQP